MAELSEMSESWRKVGFWLCLAMACASSLYFFGYERSRGRECERQRLVYERSTGGR